MKYSEILSEVDSIYPNEYDMSQKIKWLMEAENMLCDYTGDDGIRVWDLEKESIAKSPHDRMYIDFLCAQISFHQHDDESYARYIKMYNERYEHWQKWFIRTHEAEGYRYTNWIKE